MHVCFQLRAMKLGQGPFYSIWNALQLLDASAAVSTKIISAVHCGSRLLLYLPHSNGSGQVKLPHTLGLF